MALKIYIDLFIDRNPPKATEVIVTSFRNFGIIFLYDNIIITLLYYFGIKFRLHRFRHCNEIVQLPR